MSLYLPSVQDDDPGDDSQKQALEYLEPLGLAPVGTPLPELARIVASTLIPHLGDGKEA